LDGGGEAVGGGERFGLVVVEVEVREYWEGLTAG